MSESNARKEMAPVRRTADELSVVTRSQPQRVTWEPERRSSPRAWPPALASRKT